MMMMTKAFSTFKDERKTKDDKVSMLERLALSTSQEEFEKALIKGSDLQRFFSLLQAINKAAPGDFANEWADVREFCKDIERTGQGKVLRYEVLFKYLLHRISAVTDLEERKKLMGELNQNFLEETFKTLDLKKEDLHERLEQDQPQIGSSQSIKKFLEEDIYSAKEDDQRLLGHHNFSASILARVDLVKMLDVNTVFFQSAINNVPSFSGMTNVAEALTKYLALMRKTKNEKFELDANILRKMTLEQLLQVKEAGNYSYIKQVLAKSFKSESRFQPSQPPESRAAALQDAIDTVEKLIEGTPQRQIVLSTLVLLRLVDLSRAEIFDIKLLESYLSGYPLQGCSLVNYKAVKVSKAPALSIKLFECLPLPTAADLTTVLEAYIRASVKDKRIYNVLERFLVKESLAKFFMIETMLSGQKVDQILFLSEIELNHIRDRCEVTIKSVSEDGLITASLKNIPNLILTVYEINTVNYYKTKKAEFDSQLDVAGFIPTDTLKFSYSHPSIEVHRETFEVSRVKSSSKGLFIVDLTGQGLSSRAVIKRGGLNLVQTVCQSAYRYCILDETKKVCTGESAKIWMADKEYVADGDGWISIPFQSTALNEFAIIQVGDYAEPYRMSLPAIELNLKTSVVFNEESIVGGSSCDFLITPKIFAQHGQIDKLCASDYSVTIVSVNSDGVKSAQVFEDCQLNDSQTLALAYHVPRKTTSITVTTSCRVNGQSLASVFQVSTREVGSRGQTFDLTLHRQAGVFVAKASCINGSPLQRAEIRVSAVYAHTRKTESVTLVTDTSGQAVVGSLLCVKSVKLECSYRGTSAERNFEIDLASNLLSIPPHLDAVEGEDIMLPALQKDQDPAVFAISDWPYTFEEVSSDFSKVVNDCRNLVEESGGVLFLTKLTAGSYQFSYHLTTGIKTIHISVSKGERWARSHEYIMTSEGIQRLQNQTNYLTFDDLHADDNEASLRVYSNVQDSARVTLLAYYSLPPNFATIKRSAESMTVTEGRSEFKISGNSQMFMSNKEISDEEKYIIYRNQLTEDQYGSTLTRPTGLLCQQFNRSTQADSLKKSNPKNYSSSVGSVGSLRSVSLPSAQLKSVSLITQLDLGVPSLKEKGKLVGVKSVDPDGRVSFDLSSLPGHLNVLVALVEDQNNFTFKVLDRKATSDLNPERKDLRLGSSMEAGKVHHFRRETKCSRDGVTLETTDSQHALVDSLEQLFDLQRSTFGGSLSNWIFLKRWPGLERQEKLEKYNEYASHELNFFLYCKDRPFFEEVAKPYLANKAKKDLVDYFLLGDEATVRHLTRISLIDSYAPWELAMAYSLTRDAAILTYVKGITDQKEDNYKALFDSVLSFYQHEESDSSHKSIVTAGARTSAMMSGQRIDDGCEAGERFSAPSYKMAGRKAAYGPKPGKPIEVEGGYTAVGSTFEFKETYYFGSQGDFSSWRWTFWKEVLSQLEQGIAISDILSEKFVLASGGLTESIMTLAVLGLGLGGTKTGQILLTKTPAVGNEESDEKDSVIVSQVLFEKNRPFETVGNKQRVRNLRSMITTNIYTTKATVTNTTEVGLDCELTVEIPQGSIPLNGDNLYTTKSFNLKPFETCSFTQDFYFPAPGTYYLYPATASQEGKLLRHALATTKLEVKDEEASTAEYTVDKMVANHDYEAVCKLVADSSDHAAACRVLAQAESLLVLSQGYKSVIQACRERSIYNQGVWKYCLIHANLDDLREYLEHRFVRAKEPISLADFTLYYLHTPVLKIDAYKPKEYDPLVNPKVHLEGNFEHNIANKEFLDTYMHFLKYYVDKSPSRLTNADRLLFIVYLVAQDRQSVALRLMLSLTVDSEALQLQTDYLTVYALVTSANDNPDLTAAKTICDRYTNYPVLAWQRKFAAVAKLVAEISGQKSEQTGDISEVNIHESNASRASLEPSLQLTTQDSRIVLTTKNVESVSMQIFVVNIETKFSLNPFDLAHSTSAGLVKASYETIVAVDSPVEADGSRQCVIEVPKHLEAQNLLVQASNKGIVASVDYLPSKLTLSILGEELEVSAGSQRLASCYIKVYVRKSSGSQAFLFKDGYTNLIGRFDFSTVCLETIDKFAECSILAIDKVHGASILRLKGSDIGRSRNAIKSSVSASLQADIAAAVKSKSSKYAIE